jgi:hypothetical protein
LIGLLPALVLLVLGLPWFLLFLAGVLALPFSENAAPGEVLLLAVQVQLAALAVGLPVLMLLGVIRLLKRRDRKLLIAGYLPGTGLAAWFAYDHVARGGGSGWLVLLLLGPASAALFASAPSVGRWISDAGRPSRAG